MSQIQKVLKDALHLTQEKTVEHKYTGYMDEAELALDEAKAAIAKVMEGTETIELEPQPQHIRKLQHEFVDAHNLSSVSEGEGAKRHLRIFKKEE